MSDEKIPPVPLSAADVRDFVHDLRNSLYVMRLGLGMLSDVRGDAARFEDMLVKLQAEEQAATQCLDEFSRASGRAYS